MQQLSRLLPCGLAIILSGCVLSTEPIGRIPAEIDPADWEGVWVHEESFGLDAIVAVVEVGNRGEARFDISWLDLEGDVELKKSTGVLRELNDELFLNVQAIRDEAAEPTRYFWGRIERDGDLVRAWVPAYEEFKKLVTDGVLPGQIEKYEITLGELGADASGLISSSTLPTFPMTFRRIGK